MIESAAPAPGASVVISVRDVRRQCVETGPWPLSYQMHNHGGANQTAYFVADANTAVLHHDIDVSNMAGVLGQQTAQHRHQRPQVFAYRVGIQAVRDHELHLRLWLCVDLTRTLSIS